MSWIPGHEVNRECTPSTVMKESSKKTTTSGCPLNVSKDPYVTCECNATNAERLKVGCIYVMEASGA